MDRAALLIVLPFIVWVLLVGWLFYATLGGKRVRLSLRGLGVSINVQITDADDNTPQLVSPKDDE